MLTLRSLSSTERACYSLAGYPSKSVSSAKVVGVKNRNITGSFDGKGRLGNLSPADIRGTSGGFGGAEAWFLTGVWRPVRRTADPLPEATICVSHRSA